MNARHFCRSMETNARRLKSWWGKLADDDLDRIGGQKDKLIGWVQEKYGYAREQAEQEVERRIKEYSDIWATEGNGTTAVISQYRDAAKAQELGATATNKANEAATVVGEKIGSLASVIRENAPHEGAAAPRQPR